MIVNEIFYSLQGEGSLAGGKVVKVAAPGKGGWVAAIRKGDARRE